jgi:hypothetical protein
MEKDKWISYILIKDFVCIPDVLFKLYTALPHSLHFRCFHESSFLSKELSTCGDIRMAPSFLNRILQALTFLTVTQLVMPLCITTIKLKLSHHAPRKRLGDMRYSSYSFSTSTLDGCEWLVSGPGRALPPGKGPRYPLYRWTPEPVWTERLEEKSFRLCRGSNLDCPVVQPVARHCTV